MTEETPQASRRADRPQNTKKNIKKSNGPTPKKMVNYWKWVAIALLALILGTGLFLSSKLFIPVTSQPTTSTKLTKTPSLSLNLKKKQVNTIVAFYLNDFLKDSGVTYQFILEDQAVLVGTFQLLGHDVQFSLYFDPFVLENGDVQLKAKKIAIGQLNLPIEYMMNYIAKSYKLPDWVVIDSQAKTVVLKLTEFKTKEKIQILANKIDLDNDEIIFDVYLPITTKK